MSKCKNISPYLYLGDISNKNREIAALDPSSVAIMDFGVDDWIKFTNEFAQNVNYFKNDLHIRQGDWGPFYKDLLHIEDIENYKEGNLPAHQTLYVAFLKLLEYSKQSINLLNKRQYDFYLRDVLKLSPRDFHPDRVYVAFELAKNIKSHAIKKDALLDAEKSANGILMRYSMEDELIVNNSKISEVYGQYADDTGVYLNKIENPNEINSEWPFGVPIPENAVNYGISIESPDLLYKKGVDNITLEIIMANNFKPNFSSGELSMGLKFYISTDNGWEVINPNSISSNNKILTVVWNELSQNIEKPNQEAHSREGEAPVIKMLFEGTIGRKIYLNWNNNSITQVKLSTYKKYTDNFEIKSDVGVLSTESDFYPFGSSPKKGSWFKLHSEEWIGKKIESLSVKLEWKDTPDQFNVHYAAYLDQYYSNQFSQDPNLYTSLSGVVKEDNGADIFKVYTDDENSTTQMFKSVSNKFMLELTFREKMRYNYEHIDKSPYRVSLSHDFFHRSFGQVNTLAVILKKTLPNLPYTPISDNINLEVTTSSSTNDIRIFHEHPLGFKEIVNGTENILPAIPSREGNLFIALQNIQSNDNVQFLFSLEEGTENPDEIEKNGLSQTQWYYMTNNNWVQFQKHEILKDELSGFLHEGLVKLSCNEVNSDSSLMPAGQFWIGIKLKGAYDTIARINGIQEHAGRAIFQNNANSLEHLKDGLASETIKKLKERDAQIKKINQPNPSFGGKQKEDDQLFCLRVSERLKNKNRTLSTLDYNQIILKEFSYVYKVKTLNHTSRDSFNSPGDVSILVVPNVIHGKVYNILQPKLSQFRLLEIQNHVNKLNSMHVNAVVFNPVYMPIKVATQVKFHEGYDVNYYETQLKKDITDFLAPWTSSNPSELEFGGSIYKSQIIHFIENLEYVDYLREFNMMVHDQVVKEVTPEDPRVILTSVMAGVHEIKSIIKSPCLT